MTAPSQFLGRIKSVLPPGWFSTATPVLDAFLTGLASPFAFIYDILSAVRCETRITTATGAILDLVASDFFGLRLVRQVGESDTAFRAQILTAVLQPCATRLALSNAVEAMIGEKPVIFEPARPVDAGSYCDNCLGYCVAGAWGSIELPFQIFLTIPSLRVPGVPVVAGYGTAGPLCYLDFSMIPASISRGQVLSQIASNIPIGTTAWVRFQD